MTYCFVPRPLEPSPVNGAVYSHHCGASADKRGIDQRKKVDSAACGATGSLFFFFSGRSVAIAHGDLGRMPNGRT